VFRDSSKRQKYGQNLNIEKNSEEIIEIKKSDEQMLHNAAQLSVNIRGV
jgi:hypothetical protein